MRGAVPRGCLSPTQWLAWGAWRAGQPGLVPPHSKEACACAMHQFASACPPTGRAVPSRSQRRRACCTHLEYWFGGLPLPCNRPHLRSQPKCCSQMKRLTGQGRRAFISVRLRAKAPAAAAATTRMPHGAKQAAPVIRQSARLGAIISKEGTRKIALIIGLRVASLHARMRTQLMHMTWYHIGRWP